MELTNLDKILWDFNRLLSWKFGPNSRYNHMHMIATSYQTGGISDIGRKEKIIRIIIKVVGSRVYDALRKIRTNIFNNDRKL
jgi:hypothetical protein